MTTVQEFRISDTPLERLSPHLTVCVPTYPLGLPSAAEAARQAYLTSGLAQDLCLDAGDDYVQVTKQWPHWITKPVITHEAKKSKRRKRAKKPAARAIPVGSWGAPTLGSAASAICSYARPRSSVTN